MRCPEALKFGQVKAPNALRALHLDDKTLEHFRKADTVLLLSAIKPYHTHPDRPNGDFSIIALYKTGAQYVGVHQAIFAEMRIHNQ